MFHLNFLQISIKRSTYQLKLNLTDVRVIWKDAVNYAARMVHVNLLQTITVHVVIVKILANSLSAQRVNNVLWIYQMMHRKHLYLFVAKLLNQEYVPILQQILQTVHANVILMQIVVVIISVVAMPAVLFV